jgi:chitinase
MEYFVKKRRSFFVLSMLFLSVLGFSVCVSSCKTSEKTRGIENRGIAIGGTVVSTYIRTWPIEPSHQKGSPYWNADMVNARYLTDLNIAFALIDGNDKHTIYIPELRSPPMFSNIWDEVTALKKRHPQLKVNISIGGWGADHFSDMAHDPSLRAQFVAGVIDWLERYNLDGADIDWEYPVGPSWGQEIKSRPEDAANYITLMQDLRNAMNTLGAKTGKYYSVSTAVPASSWFTSAIDVVAAANIVDALKLMSYDYYGGWSSTTGHLCNIFNNPNDPAWGGWSTDQALQLYLDAGVPAKKIQMGVAFYGRSFAGVQGGPNNDGLFQPYGSIPFPENEGFVSWPQIEEFLKPGSGFTRYWDDVAKAPYLYNGNMWITYCDPELIRNLAAYSKEKGLGGFFSWEFGTDMNADLLKSLAENAQ